MATDGIDDLDPGAAAILDALYRDRDDAGLDLAQRATLGEWQAVRGLVRDARSGGFDVEPPAAGTRGSFESLMTAARAQAATARPGLWARWRAGLMAMLAHPAMAGAAALVVVGGAAGVLYLKGQRQVARPPAAEQRPAEPAPRLPSAITDGELGDVLGDRPTGDRPGPSARPDVGGSGATALPLVTEEGGRRERTPEKTPEKTIDGVHAGATLSPKVKPRSPALEDVTKGEPTATRPTEEEAPTGGVPQDLGFELDSTVTNTATPSPPMASPPPPPPPKPAAPKKPAPAQIAVDDDAPATRATRAQLQELTIQARAAAKAGDCATVAARSRQVGALDAAYHRDVFVRDPDIARCR